MRRRTLLTLGGAMVGASALGAAGLAAVQPRRELCPPPRPDDASLPERLAGEKHVVVVGGGLAGIATATALAERGFRVTLLEAASHLGGKIGGWTVTALGETFPVEHGFHGFFSQYYNLRDLLGAAGALADLVPSHGYPVLFPDRPVERFGETTSLFPFNLTSVIAQSETLRFSDFARQSDGLVELMRYDPELTFEAFDNVDFLTFARDGNIPDTMVDTVLRPFGDTTLNRVERLSAAEAIRFFHFYFLGNPEGLGFDHLARDSMAGIVDRLAERMRSLGVAVRTGTPARRVVAADGRVTGVVVGGAEPTVSIPAADVPAEGWVEVPGDAPVFVSRTADGFRALDGRCTHKGCPVRKAADGGFSCPCHGGTYDARGAVTGGPPPRGLDPLPVAEVDGRLEIRHEAAEETLACDWCVVACEVRGLKRLAAASGYLGSTELAVRMASLGESDPYVVLRLWLDAPVRADREAFYTTSGFRYTDAVAVYSQFQEPFVAWAARTGGAVVEVHAYAVAPEDMGPPEALQDALIAELRGILPELATANVLHAELQVQDDFTRFAPNDHAVRPGTATPIPNLLLAGDHVKLDVPAFLMEAAVVSGRVAANTILAAEGVRSVPIPTVPLRGPLA